MVDIYGLWRAMDVGEIGYESVKLLQDRVTGSGVSSLEISCSDTHIPHMLDAVSTASKGQSQAT
jgi:hypothetical protein